jgi:hypothetical protein
MNDQQADLQAGSGWPRDPYKGLNYFSAVDEPLFGQRELEIDDMIFLLSSFDTRAVLLHGGTGTGKSSFLRAGLCPRLQRMPVEEGRKFFFLRETRPDGSGDDPLLVRATEDPVARVYDELRKAAEAESNALSDSVRQALRQLLPEPVPRDRLNAIPAILAALKVLTAPPQRETFVLLVDQAEEVLTLPTTTVAENRRSAFFAMIEQICFRSRSMDLRLIVAMRTEYYGRFCSFFRIRPTNRLTPDTEVGAGLFDYLLRPLSGPDIAAAIRQPTSDEPRDDRLQPPRSVYGFSYKGELPEMIAADLLRQSGEASTLPAMQIVCKQLYERVVVRGGRAAITEEDYKRFGRAEGAIDAFMERALRDAAGAANLPPLSETDIDTWALVLWHVVGRAEGGTVQTLIASEPDLLKEAGSRGIAEDAARAMLNKMVDPQRRLLRLAGGEGGTSAYSLGHDSLGPSVLRRSGQAAVRAEAAAQQAAALAKAEEERAAALAAAETELAEERRKADRRLYKARLRFAGFAFAMLAVVATAGLYMTIVVTPLRERLRILTNYAETEQSGDFRLRLILLAAALRRGETWPGSWFVDLEPAKNALRNTLLRSPIFGGVFAAAAWDSKGRRVVRLENDKLVIRNLETGEDGLSSSLPASPGGQNVPPSVGLITSQDGVERLVAFRIDTATLLAGKVGSPLVDTQFEPPTQVPGVFIPRADIFGERVRIIFMHFARTAIIKMEILQLSGATSEEFKREDLGNVALDWHPIIDQAPRQPTLAEDCNAYAFLSRRDNGYTLQMGRLGANEKGRRSEDIVTALFLGAVTIARGCDAVLARDDDKLHIVSLKPGQPPSKMRSITIGLPNEFAFMVAPSAPQIQPMFAAAPLTGNYDWRVGWLTAGGLAIVDIPHAEQALSNLSLGDQMLTGVEPSYIVGSLSFSPDGLYALMMQQQSFNTPIRVRAFNLDRDSRRKALAAQERETPDALVREACRIARFQDGTNQLSGPERRLWIGSREPQPCTGIE